MKSRDLQNRVKSSWWPRPLLCVMAVGSGSFVFLFLILAYNTIFKPLDTFTAVWITHDLLVAHIQQTGNWPADWDALETNFASINQGYRVPGLAWVRDRIVINFDLDLSMVDSSIELHDNTIWFMRMADDDENREIRNANERVRSVLINRHSPGSMSQK